MTDANAVYNFDLKELFDAYDEAEADILIAYKKGPLPKVNHNMVLTLEGNEITDLSIANVESAGEEAAYSFNLFLMRKSTLERLISVATAHDMGSFTKVLQAEQNNLKIYGYEISGYAEIVDTLQKYYQVNMDLLQADVCSEIFHNGNPILTKVSDNVPALYGPDASIGNTLIADGCQIEGTVKNSILFRGVVVEKGATVENCILMQGTVVHANSSLHAVITDKNVTVTGGKKLMGDPAYPIYIAKKITV